MNIYTRIHWSVLLVGLVVACMTAMAVTFLLMVPTQGSWRDVWIGHRNVRSLDTGATLFGIGELPFPEDLQPKPRPQTSKDGDHNNIMIRRSKGRDLDPKPTDKTKLSPFAQNKDRATDSLAKRPPQCILLGFAKCGTSALLEFLDLHPNIVTLDWEPDYFCDRMYPKYDLQWYVNRMPPSYPDQVTVEKSPCYIVEHNSHIRMHVFNSSLKVMVLVRDPVVRLLSEYGHYSATERYWGRIPTPLLGRITVKSTGKLNEAQLLKTGNYLPHFEHLLSVFPRDQVLVLDGDAFIENPLSQTKLVEEFLGVPHHISDRHVYFDPDKGFYCMASQDSGERKCLGKSKGRQHEKLDDALKTRLADFYRPYNERLFRLLGQRFDWPK